MAYRRPSTYSYPPKFTKLEDAENHAKRLYAELLENDSRGEFTTAASTDEDLKELIVRPEWYGAKGDGVTDDTAAIQAALDAAGTGGMVLLGPNTYIISAPLTVPMGVMFTGVSEGNGSQLTLKAGTTVTCMVKPDQVDQVYFYIAKMMLRGNNALGSSVTSGMLHFPGGLYNTGCVRDMVIWDYTGGPGINIEPGADTDNQGAALFENIWILPDSDATGIKVRDITGSNTKFIQGFTFNHIMIELTHNNPAIDIQSSVDGHIRGFSFRDLWIINPSPYTATPVVLNGLCHSLFENCWIAVWSDTAITLSGTVTQTCYGNVFIRIMGFGSGTLVMIVDAMTGQTSVGNVDLYIQGNDGWSYFGPAQDADVVLKAQSNYALSKITDTARVMVSSIRSDTTAPGTISTNSYGSFIFSRGIGVGSADPFAAGVNPDSVAFKTGVLPNASIVDGFLEYSNDIVAGNAAPHFRTENGTVIKLDQTIDTTATPSFAAVKVGANQVVGAQGAAVADATDAASVILRLNELLARQRAHGLIAT